MTKKKHDDHLLHLWAPIPVRLDKSSVYYPRTRRRAALYLLWKIIADLLCPVLDFLVVGFRVTGRKNLKALGKSGAVVCCNHIHPLDCTMIGVTLFSDYHNFLVLQSNMGLPVVRHLIRCLGGVPIPDDPELLPDFTAQTAEALKAGRRIVVYPEAVLHPYYDGLRPFHSGAFVFAATASVPVLPMVITRHAPKGLWKHLRKKPFLHLNVLPPLYPEAALPPLRAAARIKKTCRSEMERFYSAHSDSTYRPPTQKPDAPPPAAPVRAAEFAVRD